MRTDIKRSRLVKWYYDCKRRAIANGYEVYHEWDTVVGFNEWCKKNGYTEKTKMRYVAKAPFTPENISISRYEEGDFEYIAYDSKDPYELIITSAPSIPELAEKLSRLGYDYKPSSIREALSMNKTTRPIENRVCDLVFEKIDLSTYEE